MTLEAAWEEVCFNENLQPLAGAVYEYLNEKLCNSQIASSEVDTDRDRYTVVLKHVPREFWYEVIRPEVQRLAERHKFKFTYSSCFPVNKGFVMEMNAK